MRKNYSVGDGIDLSWGFDRIVGFFVQVFDGEAEFVIRSMDQGQILDKQMPFQEELVTYGKMVDMLMSDEDAFTDFQKLLQWPLPEPIKAYNILDKNGSYREGVDIHNLKEFLDFTENIEEDYILTDFLDRKVDVSFISAQLLEWEKQNRSW